MSGDQELPGVRDGAQGVGGSVRRNFGKGTSQAQRRPQPTSTGGDYDWLKATLKKDTRILGRLQRQIVNSNEERNADRDTAHLHSSEMCKKDWCPRASWYKVIGADSNAEKVRWGLANIFEEGHGIHDKYQTWLDELGVLEGMWECRTCKHRWYATSPPSCPECGSSERKYKEVPLDMPDIMTIGHGDGILNDEKGRDLLELKSIGLGSIRMEVPGIYKSYEEDQSLTKLWSSIHHPFPSHLRQVNLYMRALGLKRAVFIYEFKANQQVKEFVVSYDPKLIAHIVEGAKVIKEAVETGKTVRRPDWAEDQNHKTCKACPYRNKCWRLDEEASTNDGKVRVSLRYSPRSS